MFGNSYLAGTNYYYPAWRPTVWNTACITVRANQLHSRVNININGQTAVQNEDIADNVLNSSKAGNQSLTVIYLLFNVSILIFSDNFTLILLRTLF